MGDATQTKAVTQVRAIAEQGGNAAMVRLEENFEDQASKQLGLGIEFGAEFVGVGRRTWVATAKASRAMYRGDLERVLILYYTQRQCRRFARFSEVFYRAGHDEITLPGWFTGNQGIQPQLGNGREDGLDMAMGLGVGDVDKISGSGELFALQGTADEIDEVEREMGEVG